MQMSPAKPEIDLEPKKLRLMMTLTATVIKKNGHQVCHGVSPVPAYCKYLSPPDVIF